MSPELTAGGVALGLISYLIARRLRLRGHNLLAFWFLGVFLAVAIAVGFFVWLSEGSEPQGAGLAFFFVGGSILALMFPWTLGIVCASFVERPPQVS
jgi:hypothetical protein